jgi:hypothetical protein
VANPLWKTAFTERVNISNIGFEKNDGFYFKLNWHKAASSQGLWLKLSVRSVRDTKIFFGSIAGHCFQG